MDVVGEFPSVASAEEAADAILIATRRQHDPTALVEPLTSREIQVLELLAGGLPNKTIAARMGISDQTVEFHVASIAGKRGAARADRVVALIGPARQLRTGPTPTRCQQLMEGDG